MTIIKIPAVGGSSGGAWDILSSGSLSVDGSTLFDLTGIEAGYKIFMVVVGGACDLTGADQVDLRFNNDSGTNYDYTAIKGDASSSSSFGVTGGTSVNIGSMNLASVNDSGCSAFITNDTDDYKTISSVGGRLGNTTAIHGIWKNASAEISRITAIMPTRKFIAGSRWVVLGSKG